LFPGSPQQPVDLGEASFDRPAVWRFLVRNGGTGPLTGLAPEVIEGATAFSCSTLPGRLNPGEEAYLTVTFAPQATGKQLGKIRIVSDRPEGPFEISMSGTGKLASITFDLPEVTGKESQKKVIIPLTLGRPLTQEVRVSAKVPAYHGDGFLIPLYRVVSIGEGPPPTALDEDFDLTRAVAVFPPGTTKATLEIDLSEDGIPEGTEFNRVTLEDSGDLLMGERLYTTFVIEDDSYTTFETAGLVVSENAGMISIPVRLNRPHASEVVVEVQPSFGGREDFAIPGTETYDYRKKLLRFPRGETTATLSVQILPDSIPDDDERYDLFLNPDGYYNHRFDVLPRPGLPVLTLRIRESADQGTPWFPRISAGEQNQLVAAGQPAVLIAPVSGTPGTASWTRDGVPVPGAGSTTLRIPAVSRADAGTYRLTVTNSFGAATSEPLTLNVVDTRDQPTVAVPVGGEINLTAPASGPLLYFVWRKDGAFFDSHTGATLSGTPKASDSGMYSCLVSLSGGSGRSIETGRIPVMVGIPTPLPPLLLTPALSTFPAGRPFSLRIPFDSDPRRPPTAFIVTGLPAGCRFDPVTGEISGRISRSGEFSYTATASNGAGVSNEVRGTFTVVPDARDYAGTWIALLSPTTSDPQLDLGGRLDFTVTASGSVSGALQTSLVRYSWRSQLSFTGHSQPGQASVDLSIPRWPPQLPIRLRLVLSAGEIVSVHFGPQRVPLSAHGWRKRWTSSTQPAEQFAGYHVFSLKLHDPDQQPDAGTGFGSASVNTDGTVRFLGQTGDGQPFSFSSVLGPEGELALFASFYAGQGSLRGIAEIEPDTGRIGNAEPIAWRKRPSTRPTPWYPSGIDATVNLQGARHQRPQSWSTLLGPDASGEATALVTGTGFAPSGSARLALKLDSRSVILPTSGLPRFHRFQLNPRTGFFTGTILREEPGARGSNPRAPIRRELPCSGVFVNGGGAGYVRIPAPGSGSNQPILHGTVEIQQDSHGE
jgi:hypothetical protein